MPLFHLPSSIPARPSHHRLWLLQPCYLFPSTPLLDLHFLIPAVPPPRGQLGEGERERGQRKEKKRKKEERKAEREAERKREKREKTRRRNRETERREERKAKISKRGRESREL